MRPLLPIAALSALRFLAHLHQPLTTRLNFRRSLGNSARFLRIAQQAISRKPAGNEGAT